MVITSHMSHMSDTLKSAVPVAHLRSPFWLFAAMSLVLPGAAWGDVYKWMDAKGKAVFSDVLPKQGEKVKNFEVVAKETRPAPKAAAQVPTPTEQALLERIQNLERQQQVQQYLASVPVFPPPSPPQSSYYDSGYYASYYPSYYPSYAYPVVRSYSYAAYPVVRSNSYVAYPARTYASRPVFSAPRGGSFHGGGGFHSGGGHRGRR
jgi:hypothetical protein